MFVYHFSGQHTLTKTTNTKFCFAAVYAARKSAAEYINYFLWHTEIAPSYFGRELCNVGLRYDTEPRIFRILYLLRFWKCALLPCMLCSLTAASKNVNLVRMKNSQKAQKVGKFYNINFHFAGNHYIQNNFTFWPSAFKLLDLCEKPVHRWKALGWRIVKITGLWSDLISNAA